ncbi:unnamed protein product [Pedinophyceae sp. YPF-701]|nr:unnamed protein product [Pedinophyceae sp. YPF-701]
MSTMIACLGRSRCAGVAGGVDVDEVRRGEDEFPLGEARASPKRGVLAKLVAWHPGASPKGSAGSGTGPSSPGGLVLQDQAGASTSVARRRTRSRSARSETTASAGMLAALSGQAEVRAEPADHGSSRVLRKLTKARQDSSRGDAAARTERALVDQFHKAFVTALHTADKTWAQRCEWMLAPDCKMVLEGKKGQAEQITRGRKDIIKKLNAAIEAAAGILLQNNVSVADLHKILLVSDPEPRGHGRWLLALLVKRGLVRYSSEMTVRIKGGQIVRIRQNR